MLLAEDIYLTGSVDALENWSPDNALILSPANYPTWSSEFFLGHSSCFSEFHSFPLSVTLNVPVSAVIQYKYIRKVNGQLSAWESDPNNQFTSPSSGSLGKT